MAALISKKKKTEEILKVKPKCYEFKIGTCIYNRNKGRIYLCYDITEYFEIFRMTAKTAVIPETAIGTN